MKSESERSRRDFVRSINESCLERLILFLYPTLVILLSALFLGRPVTRRVVLALVLSYRASAWRWPTI